MSSAPPTVEQRNDALLQVTKDGMALKKMPEDLRDDEDIVFAAVDQNTNAFRCASKRLRFSKPFLSRLVQVKPYVLVIAPKSMQSDPDLFALAGRKAGPLIFFDVAMHERDNEYFYAEVLHRMPDIEWLLPQIRIFGSDRLKSLLKDNPAYLSHIDLGMLKPAKRS